MLIFGESLCYLENPHIYAQISVIYRTSAVPFPAV